ncbi:MAG: aminotransferase class III-fold pyridoxal phosphate-dependent enzyme [Firmicutes bacterium]|nr:aminotransferase class III-fold pyridoxal phosphate-dependent enzyme [Bacillota bacterium]
MSTGDGRTPPEDPRELDRRYVWHPLTQHAGLDAEPLLMVVAAQRHVVIDDAGRAYLDAMAGLWCVQAGYGRTEIAEAVHRQMRRLAYYPHTQANAPAAELAARLARLLGGRLRRTYFTASGSEANEAAFKISRQYHLQRGEGRRYKILGRHYAYHGTTLATLAAGGMAARAERFEPLPGGFVRVVAPYCYRCPFGLAYPSCGVACARQVEEVLRSEGPGTVAAMVLEPVQSAAGVLVPPREYLPMVAEACRRHGVLLIVDEVINGFGRTGRMFAHQWYGVEPDLVTMAKGLTSAYVPMAAVTATDEVFSAFLGAPGSGREAVQVSTFGGHPVAAAAALANLDILERERLAENAREVGAYLLEKFEGLRRHAAVGDVRGIGLLLAVELVADRASRRPLEEALAAQVVRDCLEAGVIVGRTVRTYHGGGHTLTFAPPLIWTREEADELVAALDRALRRLEA